ncbi:uncharacterized protein OCT59_025565 [Rhizophagus irregularis]|uniref:uncharacterized protein n=1 Tax=Rhizophagus irregularis TaxID=588596 RepID=UPI0019EC079F|nr:hypothetical protein OCT59_025565 [Rhizophagus irregularis]GET51472.1 glycoside hydrolase family 125 protein [Rhizophagus irregularis DAOM 181602=DAOM 197198]CAB4388662.1 unnamed protein product [Rhizophagus irregularis]
MFLFKSSANNEETTTKTEYKSKFPFVRPKESERKFVSPVIEKVIKDITSNMKDKDLARLFENCWPNTLDTTVAWFNVGEDFQERSLLLEIFLQCVIYMQAELIISDPYANAYYAPPESKV